MRGEVFGEMAFLKPKFKFGASGGSGNPLLDEAEHQRQEELGRLYISTRAAKHFQKDVVKGVEGFVYTGNKQLEISNKLAEDCKKYGTEGPSVKAPLSRATIQYSSARNKMEKERENFHKALASLVTDPLKAMINGAPLKDARNLKQKYDRLRQDADSQAVEVTRRRAKEAKEGSRNPEQVAKLQAAEQKMDEIASAMETVGKNATTSMGVVESQQQNTSLQKILAMIEYERAYYQRVTGILDQLHNEIESQVKGPSTLQLTSYAHNGPSQATEPHSFAHNGARQATEPYIGAKQATEPHNGARQATEPHSIPHNGARQATEPHSIPHNGARQATEPHSGARQAMESHGFARNGAKLATEPHNGARHAMEPHSLTHSMSNGSSEDSYNDKVEEVEPEPEEESFYATCTHDFEGEDEGELTISIDDEVLVRQVTSSGWSEGQCNGESGWFPSTYVKKEPVRRGVGGASRAGSNHR